MQTAIHVLNIPATTWCLAELLDISVCCWWQVRLQHTSPVCNLSTLRLRYQVPKINTVSAEQLRCCWPSRVCCHTLTKSDCLTPLQNSTLRATIRWSLSMTQCYTGMFNTGPVLSRAFNACGHLVLWNEGSRPTRPTPGGLGCLSPEQHSYGVLSRELGCFDKVISNLRRLDSQTHA